ncbi:MAG: HDIG domain-containing protein [Myxococcota bacterium]|jgi:poly(A) polymerase|nr:HDIG domain-containing protein [Myxococcota bacterium]
MLEPADILALAPAIAAGEDAPVEASVRDVGRLLELEPGAALACLDATLSGSHAERGLEWLERTGAMGVWLPEVQSLMGFHTSSPAHHKDLWAHTVEVVGRTPADGDLRWVALLHDIGKVDTRAIDARGRVTFYGHERLGAQLVSGVTARLGMSTERADRIAFVVEHHARVNAYEPGWTDRAVRRLIRDAGEHLDDMLRFSGADYTTRRRERASRIRAHLADLTERIGSLRRRDATPAALPPGLGRVLCHELRLEPGPGIGELLIWLEAEVTAGRLAPRQGHATYVEAARRRLD